MEQSPLQILATARGLKLVEIARAIGVHKATVTRWAQGDVPAERAIEIERAMGIGRHELRPDLWPSPSPEGAPCS